MIVNGRSLARPPTDNQHLYGFVPTNTMAPVVTLFKTEIRLKVAFGDLDGREPGTDLLQSWRSSLLLQFLNQFRERQRGSLCADNFFGIKLCRQDLGLQEGFYSVKCWSINGRSVLYAVGRRRVKIPRDSGFSAEFVRRGRLFLLAR